MAFLRKIKAGLVKTDIDAFVGEEGNLFFNTETGEIRLSDGLTEGGIAVSGGGGGGTYTLPTASTTVKGGVKVDGSTISITSQVISVGTVPYNKLSGAPVLSTVATSGSYTDLTNKPTIPSMTVSLINSSNTVSNPLTNITAIRFDTDSGFDVTDLGGGAVKVGMNSTFKTWKVNGQIDLVANGLDTIEIVAGNGVTITTNPSSSPFKQISISAAASLSGNLDLGGADTNFGGLEVIDAGGI